MSDFTQVRSKHTRSKMRPKVEERPRTHAELCAVYERIVRKYKTEKCPDGFRRSFTYCGNGKMCFDAHTETELRRDPLVAKGVVRYTRGFCAYKDKDCPNGRGCQLAHNDCETMYHPKTYKTKPCKNGDKCERGDFCAFKHSEDILTPDVRNRLFLSTESMAPAPRPQYQNQLRADQLRAAIGGPAAISAPPAPSSASLAQGFQPMPSPQEILEEQVQHQASERQRQLDDEKWKQQERVRKMQQERMIEEQLESSSYHTSHTSGAPASPPLAPSLPPSLASSLAPALAAAPAPMAPMPPMPQAAATIPMPTPRSAPAPAPAAKASSGLTVSQSSASLVISLLDPHFSLSPEHAEALLELLSASPAACAGADANGNTALLYAVSRGLHRLVRPLANVETLNAANSHQQTPLSIAVGKDDTETLLQLLQCGVDPNVAPGALLYAISTNSMQVAEALARHPAMDRDLEDEGGTNALLAAAEKGFEDIVRALATHRNGALLDKRNARGQTPILLAVNNGHISTVQALFDLGATDGGLVEADIEPELDHLTTEPDDSSSFQQSWAAANN